MTEVMMREESLAAEKDRLAKECKALRSRIAVLETINSEFRSRYDQLQTTVQELKQQIEELSKNNNSASFSNALEVLAKDNDRLSQAMDKSRQDYEELNDRYIEEKKRAEEKEILISKGLIKLKNMFAVQQEKQKALEEEIAKLNDKCRHLEAELEYLKEILSRK